MIRTPDPAVLALRCDWQGQCIVTLHNLSDRKAEASLPGDGIGPLQPLFGDVADRRMTKAGATVRLNPYGYRWFRAHGERR